MKTVLVADDHPIVRRSVRGLIEQDSSLSLSVVGEASDAAEALSLLDSLQPDILLLDIALPGKSGIEVLRELRAKGSNTKVIILTMHQDELTVRRALMAGANAYIPKTEGIEVLLEAIGAVERVEVFVPKAFYPIINEVQSFRRTGDLEKQESLLDPLEPLSAREREVFFLLVEGDPNRVVAKKLTISPRTVETHRARVFRKLDIQTTAGLVRFACAKRACAPSLLVIPPANGNTWFVNLFW